MKIHRAISDSGMRKISAWSLTPDMLERAVSGLSWTSAIAAVTSVTFTVIQHLFQPEFADAWKHPVLRVASLTVFGLSLCFIAVQYAGWFSKRQLMGIGVVFQVAVAFAAGLFEGAAHRDPNAVVVGLSGISAWMMLCGRLMPKPPLLAAGTAALCVLMWPLAYLTDVHLFGYERMPVARMLVWILPLCIIAVWVYILNNRTIRIYQQQQSAEDMGSYSLRSLIGRGGMGEVWKATHRTLAREAALKLIRPATLHAHSIRRESEMKRRFELEAQATASLRCPHTVALYDYGQAKCGSFYYAMELIDGIDLHSLVKRFGPMNPSRVVHILCQVSQSLEEAHCNGLVHRDIKPGNILLGKIGLEYDFVKVLDFGLVKLVEPEDSGAQMTAPGVPLGTPSYIAPETALGHGGIDGRADLYSLGCTAYYLLTGHTVFDAKSATGQALAHIQAPPPPMHSRTELPVPASLEQVIMQLLEKERLEAAIA